MSELKPIIEESMTQYAGAVLQSRALIDVRDGLKPSARQILYCMQMCKYTADKPFQASAAVVGDALKYFYVHGDSSCLGIIMRMGQPFAMRYPLVSVGGNYGTLISSGNWAAARYTKARLSKLSKNLFADIDKDTIEDWRDNYADTEKYPSVLPTKGFYNLCNGTQGIGIGMAASVPQFNLREINEAIIKLIDNPNCFFEEIYCAPDFATGAILYNEDEVKNSLENGTGFACKLRSVVEFDQKERCFVVTEIPYSVYTETICGELEDIINSEENPGVDRFNDLTGKEPLIKIYLNKKANPDKVLKFLFKNTSLQYYYGINMTMLDQGRFPRVFTWKEALQAFIDHQKVVYRRGYEFDLAKVKARLHIIEGLLICMANIDEVVHTIKSSSSAAAASLELQKKFLLDELQTKAILDMKLSRLAHLEVEKLNNEKIDLVNKEKWLIDVLDNAELLNNEIKKDLRDVADKYGDARRTKIVNLVKDSDEPIEEKSVQISLTNKNNLLATEVSTLYTQKRGSVGAKIKLKDGEYIIQTLNAENTKELLLFTTDGNFYHYPINGINLQELVAIEAILPLKVNEQVCTISSLSTKDKDKFVFCITKNGLIKKTELSEYNLKRGSGAKAIDLREGDKIVQVIVSKDCCLGVVTEFGNFLEFDTKGINPIGRTAKGVIAVKLETDDSIIHAKIIPTNITELVSVSGQGLIKRMDASEFMPQGRGTKGKSIQKLTDSDWIADFLPLTANDKEILIASTSATLKININDINKTSRTAQGVKSIKMKPTDNIVGLSEI